MHTSRAEDVARRILFDGESETSLPEALLLAVAPHRLPHDRADTDIDRLPTVAARPA